MNEMIKNNLPIYFLHNEFGEISAQFLASLWRIGVTPFISFDLFQKQLNSRSTNSIAVYIDHHLDSAVFLQNPFVYSIVKFGIVLPQRPAHLIYEVVSEIEAEKAINLGAMGLILKGNEAAGVVGDDATFILFQKIRAKYQIPVWLRGGIGLHNSATAIGLGAQGVILEESCYLFPELGVDEEFKKIFSRLDGSETREIQNQRCYQNLPYWPKEQNKSHVSDNFFSANITLPISPKNPLLKLGQAIGLAAINRDKFGSLSNFISHLNRNLETHLLHASQVMKSSSNTLRFNQELGLRYPIAQGPMTRVSDAPTFIQSVSQEGALPFFALAMLKGEEAQSLLTQTQNLLADLPWGIGVLGFIDEALQQEQFEYVKTAKPTFILVAGGDSSHVKRYESTGAKVFIHAPSQKLLDIYLKDGVQNFVFEGRECGGHIGPLSSFVLWEQCITRLLQEKNLNNITCYFAGGIHDELSAAFINIMTAPLMARGAKVGLLMGTAYLYTEEAVADGAILKKYQNLCATHQKTTLLESSTGHVIRCLQTPFTEQFKNTKEKLVALKEDTRIIQNELDALNVGRLRIASKGLKRREGDKGLELCTEQEQHENGLYMVGQVSTMPQHTKTIAQLHKQVTEGANLIVQKTSEDFLSLQSEMNLQGIAIIGMSCLLPDAQNLNQYWANILDNKNSIVEVPKERWDAEIFFDANAKKGKKSNSKWGGFIPPTEFDPTEFGIPPQSLAAIDPAQLFSLQATKDALVDAGYWKSDRLDRENTAVIFGTEGGSELLLGYELRAALPRLFSDLPDAIDDILPSLTEDSFSGTLPNVISGRIANRLDFGARNFVVDAACASSLAALDIACQELKNHRANVVVAGAVDLHNDLIDYLKFSSVGALSSEGLCKSFSEDASGIALGEGVGVLILKRVEDAVRDNDKIYAVIKGVGASSDGKSLGLTAPRKQGQMLAYERAYKEANVNPLHVGMIEAHGTGTVVGDKVELESLSEFFLSSGATQKSISLGSVKTQIGHTKCAAGLASVIKTALSLYHGVKPATQHLQQPNKAYNELESPFEFQETATVWAESKRVAGVSAFGFGGTNFHMVLENYAAQQPKNTVREIWPCELFVIRAQDTNAVLKQVSELLFLIEKEADLRLSDLAYTLATQNTLPIKWVFTAHNRQELMEKLRSISQQKSTEGVYLVEKIEGKIAFLFSGQGSQRINMARELFVAFPQIREMLKPHKDLQDILFPKRTFDGAQLSIQKTLITRTENAQPLLGIVDLAVANLLTEFGVQPDHLAGHSYGEIPALSFAGVIDEKDVIAISKARGYAILDAVSEDTGTMLALNIERSILESLVNQFSGIYIANHNTGTQWVVAGKTGDIKLFISHLENIGQAYKELPVACAFHSPVIADAESNFARKLEEFVFSASRIPVWSNTTASLYPTSTIDIKTRLSEHLVKPVKFFDQIEAMHEQGVKVFIEVGPGRILTNITKDILLTKAKVLSTVGEKGQCLSHFVEMLAQFVATGNTLNFEKIFSGRNVKKVDLDEMRAKRKSNVLWLLRGNRVDPVFMNAPAHSSKELREPIQLESYSRTTINHQPTFRENLVKEQMILEYLANMRAMIEAQQNVVLSYFNEGKVPHTNFPAINIPTVTSVKEQDRPTVSIDVKPASVAVKDQAMQAIATQHSVLAAPHRQAEVTVSIKVLNIICEKTGYPIEMLDLAMDLEADLSIDSIKRTEIIGTLKTTFSDAFKASEGTDFLQRLGSMKTIGELIGCLELQIKAEPIRHSSIQINSSSADVRMSSQSFSTLLINIVSERTGYPEDMLNMEMDLEADLSIDSIKRTEIISALKSTLHERKIHIDESQLVKASQGKTLQEIVNALDIQSNNEGGYSAKKFQAVAESLPDEVCRYRFELEPTAQHAAINSCLLDGKRIGIFTGETIQGLLLRDQLIHLGASVEFLTREYKKLTHLDGFIYLDTIESTQYLNPNELFALTKQLDAQRIKWFFILSDVIERSALAKDAQALLQEVRGTYGFINTLNKEWPGICREISVKNVEPDIAVKYLVQEFFDATKNNSFIHYNQSTRYINRLCNADWKKNSAVQLQLSQDDVVLVMGGAQGITAEILQHMAAHTPCHYVLVGRTPVPSFDSVDQHELALTLPEVKSMLLTREKFATPKALEMKASLVYKQNQILLSKRKLESTGAKVSYFSADLTDREQLNALLETIKNTFGRLDGIIHASGHLEDKLTIDKTQESYDRVVATKLAPLNSIINELKSTLKYCVFFSSVTSVFGNKGQIDYGTANAVFDQLANELNTRLPTKVIAINWGPWKGKGMIDQSLEQDFIRRGIKLIPLKEGAKAFLNELLYGEGGQAILMMPVKDLQIAKDQF